MWEYKVTGLDQASGHEQLEQELNNLAEEGWELTAKDACYFFLKRRIDGNHDEYNKLIEDYNDLVDKFNDSLDDEDDPKKLDEILKDE